MEGQVKAVRRQFTPESLVKVGVLSALPLESRIRIAVVLLLTLAALDGLRLVLFSWSGVNPYSAVGHIFIIMALAIKFFGTSSLGFTLMMSRMVSSAILVGAVIWLVTRWLVSTRLLKRKAAVH